MNLLTSNWFSWKSLFGEERFHMNSFASALLVVFSIGSLFTVLAMPANRIENLCAVRDHERPKSHRSSHQYARLYFSRIVNIRRAGKNEAPHEIPNVRMMDTLYLISSYISHFGLAAGKSACAAPIYGRWWQATSPTSPLLSPR